VHGADDASVAVSALVAHDADAFDGQQHRERLPDLAVEAGRLDLVNDDGVCGLQQGHALGRDLAQNAHRETGAGKRLAIDDVVGHAEVAADAADLVLEEVAQWLDELELHVRGQAADVVVALDGLRRTFDAGGLDDVGVERALDEPGDLFALMFGRVEDLLGFVIEDADELVADSLALLLGIGDLGERVEEARAGVDGNDLEAELLAHRLLHFGELVFAQDAVVDEDAGEAVTNGAGDQHGGNAGIDAAGEAADGVAVADLGADSVDRGLDEVLGCPVRFGAADIEHEVAEQFHALARVGDFRVKLDGPDAARLVGDAGEGVRGLRGEDEALGERLRFVAVAHPDLKRARQAGEERRLGDDVDLGMAVLARWGGLNFAAEVVHDELQAVADAEDGHAHREQRGVGSGRVGVVDRAGAAGENEAQRSEGADLVERRGAGKHDREDVEFADAARDELGVLRPKVQDDDC